MTIKTTAIAATRTPPNWSFSELPTLAIQVLLLPIFFAIN
jgi:hypothetical protein